MGGYALLLLCIIFIAWKAFSKRKRIKILLNNYTI